MSEQMYPVTKQGHEQLKTELKHLMSVVRPEVVQAIADAREHGDLKENSEYKMARQDQDILLSRKNELEVDLSRARVSDFTDVSSDVVGIGSIVELKEGSSGKTRRYSILGAWDSDPDNDVLSYKTKIGGNEEDWTLLKLARWVDMK